MTTDQQTQVWNSLKDKEYREHFAANVGVGLAFQIRLLREKQGWTQEELAQRAGKRQEMISQWEDPNYGRFTLNTLRDLAAAFDVALVVRFAPFSELVDWETNLTPARLAPLSFAQDSLATNTMLPHYIVAENFPLGFNYNPLRTVTTVEIKLEPGAVRLWQSGVMSDPGGTGTSGTLQPTLIANPKETRGNQQVALAA